MAKVGILGAGVMASALSFPLSDNGHEVRLVGTHLDEEIIGSIKDTGIHPGLDRCLPESVRAHRLGDIEEAFAAADVIMSGVNSFGVRWAAERIAPFLKPGSVVLSVTKGMEADKRGNLKILPDVLAEAVEPELRDRVEWTAVAGPSIAGEVAARRQTCVVFTGRDGGPLELLARMFRTDYYHVWTSTDFVGVEVCAATKNCYALGIGFAEGILDRLGERDGRDRNHDYEAALFGQAAAEIGQMVSLLGGDPATCWGLPGVGDMYVTSTGGRNVRAGRLVGAGLRFSEARERMAGTTLEGAAAIEVVGGAVEKLTGRGLVPENDLPLLRHLYAVVADNQPLDMPWSAFFGGEGGEAGEGAVSGPRAAR